MSADSKSSIFKVYLDHSATTPVDREVVEAMLPYFTRLYGNPSSLHSFGREAHLDLEDARATLAGLINARESEIYFVSGGTEADNLAIQGTAQHNRIRGNHIITTAVEHPAVLNTCKALQKKGVEVTFLGVDEYGQVAPETVQAALRAETILISVIHANNEVGTINPVARVGEIAREAGIYFHTDAVQSFGKVPIDVQEMNLDLLSISGHKIYGPKGIGALYIRRGVQIGKLVYGGNHERNRRAGTENIPGIVGLVKAAEIAHQKMEATARRVGELRDYLQSRLQSDFKEIRINGHPTFRLYNNLNVSFSGCDNETLLMSLDMKGIAVSSGAACSSGSLEPSHVLKAMGLPSNRVNSAIRFSLGKDNTREEIDYALNILKESVNVLRKMHSDKRT
jgi:cysteine desulfurase